MNDTDVTADHGRRAMIVLAHPCADSLAHANADAARRGLLAAGYTVDVLDLYAAQFVAAMSRAEHAAYESLNPILDQQVADHARRLGLASVVVFVYPTWWSSVPAILKGWFDRVLVPGVGFTFDERSGRVRPGMGHIERIVGISTYGSPKPYVKLMHDNGRRLITRTFRMACGWRTRHTWLGLYAIDTATTRDRERFLARVETTMAALK